MSLLSNRVNSIHQHNYGRNIRNKSACSTNLFNSNSPNNSSDDFLRTKSNLRNSLAYLIKISYNASVNKTPVSKSRRYTLYNKNNILRRLHREIMDYKIKANQTLAGHQSFHQIPSLNPDELMKCFQKTQHPSQRPTSFVNININPSPIYSKKPIITIKHKIAKSFIQPKLNTKPIDKDEPYLCIHSSKIKESYKLQEMLNIVKRRKYNNQLSISIPHKPIVSSTPKKQEQPITVERITNFPNIQNKSKRKVIFEKFNN